jgi:deferrochelatase/peroxidase EfeB
MTAQTTQLSAFGFIARHGAQANPGKHMGTGGTGLMRELQGNILHAHGRNHAVLLFLRFHRTTDARRWLRDYASRHLTTAWHEACGEHPTMIHIALSADGYRALRIAPRDWPQPVERPGTAGRPDVFRTGMKMRAEHLVEPDAGHWDPAFQGEIHAMVMAACDDPRQLIRAEWNLLAETRGIATIAAIERVFDIREGLAEAADPSSEEDLDSLCNQSDYTPADAMAQLLISDPAGIERVSYGSYFVFRKLEHDLSASQAASRQFAERFGIGPESTVALARRTSVSVNAVPKAWQTIARRCLAYGGGVTGNAGRLPSRGRGLLFMCYQANIREQFEAVQRWWSAELSGSSWSSPESELAALCSGFSPHVTLRGGEYFFSPSASFFRNLPD